VNNFVNCDPQTSSESCPCAMFEVVNSLLWYTYQRPSKTTVYLWTYSKGADV